MTSTDPRALVQNLTRYGTELLRQASQQAYACGHYEVTVEHYLESLLGEQGGEVHQIMRQLGIEREALLSSVTQSRRRLRSGNGGRPRLSPSLISWMLDSWITASLERQEFAIRTGVMMLQLTRKPQGYLDGQHPWLERLDTNTWADALDAHCADSSEGVEAGHGDAPAATPDGRREKNESALSRFTIDLTRAAENDEIDPIFGRQREIRQLVDVLVRRRKNNPLIVGEPGVGKTALVEGLALAIHREKVPPELAQVRLLSLDLGALRAGAQVKGEFERRFKQLLQEVKDSPTPIVLFIDEAHMLAPEAGNAGSGDAANLLKPALARGEMRTIAATTWAEYKRYFEKDAALERRFQPIRVEEPSEEKAIAMLRGLRARYEEAHQIVIRDEAIEAAVRLAKRYLPGRQLPDKAVDLLDTTAARLRVEQNADPEELTAIDEGIALAEEAQRNQERLARVGETDGTSRQLEIGAQLEALQKSRQEVLLRFEAQAAALQGLQLAQKEALAEPAGNARVNTTRAWQTFRELTSEQAMLSPDVDADAIARTVSNWTGIPLGKMKADTVLSLTRVQEELERRVVGQRYAARQVSEALQIAGADIHDPQKPVGVFLFVGPSGVGKTETALTIADQVYGGERFLTTVNMSEFQEKHMVSRLVGSPPGYVGYGEGGKLTEAVRKQPYSVLLLDEVEKAHPDVLNLFYQVFDKGVLADGEGRQVSFRNTLIILTSNLASEQLEMLFAQTPPLPMSEIKQAIRPCLAAHFKPALLARMTVVPFNPIAQESMESIVEMKLQKLSERIRTAHGLTTQFSPAVRRQLAERSLVGKDGARSIDHLIQQSVMPLVAKTLLHESDGTNEPFEQLAVDVSQNGELALSMT